MNFTGFFRTSGGVSENDVHDLKKWFKKTMMKFDPKIYANSEICQNPYMWNRLAKIACDTGVSVSGLGSFFVAKQTKSWKVLEVGFIRFPC